MKSTTRRIFLISTAGVAGALIVGASLLVKKQRLTPDEPLRVGRGQFALNGWVKVGEDNLVTVMLSQSEMGQGAHTGLAMLLAEEMDVAWDNIRVEQSGLDRIYNNQAAYADSLPFHPDDNGVLKLAATGLVRTLVRNSSGHIVTGGSSSIKDQWLPLRVAGASARAALVRVAAGRWRVAERECRVEQGRVLHGSGRSTSFGELAAEAAQIAPPRKVQLKPPEEFKLIGQPVRRIDSEPKLNGSAGYGLDVQRPDMHYARVIMCPTLGGRAKSIDMDHAATLKGVVRVMMLNDVPGSISGGIAVIAKSPFAAIRAAEDARVEWDHGPAAGTSSQAIFTAMSAALDSDPGRIYSETGQWDEALAQTARELNARYQVPYLAHATMEPMNCTVQVTANGARLWAPTQSPANAVNTVAQVLGIEPGQVQWQVPFLGGGFGRRIFTDYIAQAATIARHFPEVPVQTFWTREDDMTHDFFRPAAAARFKAVLDDSGDLMGLHMSSVAQSMGAPKWLDNSMDGASSSPYVFRSSRFDHRFIEAPVPIGIWRSVNNSQNAFFLESFLDEIAHAGSHDPIALRLSLLAERPRLRRVLERARDLSGWNSPLSGRGRGVALHRCFGSSVAQVVEVSLDAQNEIRVHRVTCVVDCGSAVNPNLIRQQMEGAIVDGISAALYGEITLEQGQVQQRNFDGYRLLRLNECPEIQVDIIPSTDRPGGVGEPGLAPVAPAVANALFALTGRRLRTLPLRFS